jgi:hypothetical protein
MQLITSEIAKAKILSFLNVKINHLQPMKRRKAWPQVTTDGEETKSSPGRQRQRVCREAITRLACI